ncbi:MAG: FecR family protein [Deltaproteobacteria bacterium]|nr:FecR family protein [Deltaproteobacteria bacterium]
MRGKVKVNYVTLGFRESIFKVGHLFNLLFLFSLVCFPPFLFFSPVDSMAADAPVGKLAIVSGKVTVKRAGAEKRTVAAGHYVFVGDIVQTEKNSMSRVVFTDDSFINLSSATALMIRQFTFDPEENRRTAIMKVLGGMARFVIYKQRNGSFNVETNSASVRANIADFGVAVLPDETEVAVLDGAVSVENISPLTIGKIRLGINQKTIVREKTPPSEPVTLSLKQRKVYLKDVLRF